MTQPIALIVEDDPTLGTIFEHTIRSADYQTQVIQEGQAALDYLEAELPYLILLDLHLPLVSGREILERIRASKRLKDTFVIVCSADSRMSDQLAKDANMILNKPVSVFQLQHLAKRFHPKSYKWASLA